MDVVNECYGHRFDVSNRFFNNRFQNFLEVLNEQLKRQQNMNENNNSNNNDNWLFGDKPCTADIWLADLMRRFEHAKPEIYKKCKFNQLKTHHKKFEQLPNIQQFYNSKQYIHSNKSWFM